MPGRALKTPLLTADQIQTRIHAMARDIERDYPPHEPLHFVAILKGAFMFLSDLSRAMTRPVTLDFMAVSTYANGTRSSGEVRVIKDVETNLHGRNVIIVEDIVDTGLTLAYLRDILQARSPRTLKAACLLSKPSRRLVDVVVDYVGFEIEDRFVVGYGLDHGEQFRHLPYVAAFE